MRKYAILILLFSGNLLFGQLSVSERIISQIENINDCSTLYPKYLIHSKGFVRDCNPSIDTTKIKILKYLNDNLILSQEQLQLISNMDGFNIKIPLRPRMTKDYPQIINSPDKRVTKTIQEAIGQYLIDFPKGYDYDSIIIYSVNKCDYYKDLVKRLYFEGITISDISIITDRNDFFDCVKSYELAKQKHYDLLTVNTISYLMTDTNINIKLYVPNYFETIAINQKFDINVSRLSDGFSISYRPNNLGTLNIFGLYISKIDTDFLFLKFNSFIDSEIRLSPIKIDRNNFKEYMDNLKNNGH